MRNIFDQYSQPENKLSHALATTLAMNPRLCREFVSWITGKPVAARAALQVEQQKVPGSDPRHAKRNEKRGLPDICIHYGADEWCLVIESKVGQDLSADQLRRHRSTVGPNFRTVELAAITAKAAPRGLAKDVLHRTWEEVYRWMRKGGGPAEEKLWRNQLRDYMRLLEAPAPGMEYQMAAAITTFDSIPFGPDHPYSYREAKLLLQQAIPRLRNRKEIKALGANPDCRGRPAITGEGGTAVWDLIALRPKGTVSDFTRWPHFTLGIRADMTEAMLTIPNRVQTTYQARLRALGVEGFMNTCRQIVQKTERAFGKNRRYLPLIRLVQRHYKGMKKAFLDGDMSVDLRVALEKPALGIRSQPHWLDAAYRLATEKKGANIQLQVGVWFPHEEGLLNEKGPIDCIEAAWSACKPVIDILLGRE